mgnify:CR=1 FL=1
MQTLATTEVQATKRCVSLYKNRLRMTSSFLNNKIEMELEGIKLENLVKLDPMQRHLIMLGEGRLTYIQHPEKGIVGVDTNNVFVNTIELSEEVLSRFK